MELHSTAKTAKQAAKKEIDVEKMVQTFSIEDFMKGLYVTQQYEGKSKGTVADKNQLVMAALMSGKGLSALQQTMDDVAGFSQDQVDPVELEKDQNS